MRIIILERMFIKKKLRIKQLQALEVVKAVKKTESKKLNNLNQKKPKIAVRI